MGARAGRAFVLRPTRPRYVRIPSLPSPDATVIPAVVAATALVGAPSIPVYAVTVAAVADVPFADNGLPPSSVTDFVAVTASDYSVSLTWNEPTEVDFDHVLILRTTGLPYANPGDELLDPAIDVVPIDSHNATFTAATVVDVGSYADVQSTVERPNTGPQDSPGSWYVYTPDASGTMTISTIGSEFDTYLYLFEDDGTTVIAQSDDEGAAHGGASTTSWLSTAVVGGTTYYILAQGFSSTDTGDLYFNLDGPAPAGATVSAASTLDTGLQPNTTYYYAIYTYDWAGNVNSTQVTAVATTTGIAVTSAFDISVEIYPGTFAILDGTPVDPVGAEDIVYYGVPFNIALDMPAGVSWNVNLLEPPPVTPGTEGPPLVDFDPAIVRTPTDITVELWNYTNTQKIRDLDYSAAREFLDEYNGVGSGGLQIPSMHADAAELLRDRVLRFKYKDIPDPVFASILETRKTAVVAEAGSAWTEVSGRGLLSWLEDAVVLPFVYDRTQLPTGYKIMADGSKEEIQSNIMANAPDVRAFNFGSRDAFEHDLFDDLGPGSGGSDPALAATWVTPVGVSWSARSDYAKGNPVKWPDHTANWISIRNPQVDAPDNERLWFRGSFIITEETVVDLHMTADNYCDWYLDGEWLVKTVNHIGEDKPYAWSMRSRTLQPGIHWFQAALQNSYRPALAYNPSSILGTILKQSDQSLVFHTNTAQWAVTTTPQTFETTAANHGPGWHRPLGISQSALAPLNVRQYFPTDWPDPNAKWIWGSDPTVTLLTDEVCWFRAKIWIPASGTYRWFSTGDDSYMVWFDGIEIASLNYDVTAASGWQRTDEIDLDLDQGWHVVAMRGQNRVTPYPQRQTARNNPAAVLGTLMTLDANLKPLDPVPWTATDNAAPPGDAEAGWWANWAGPAWKAGDVLLTLVEEAQARGVTRLQNVTMDFTRDLDSTGAPWTTRVSRTWDVGTSLLQVAFDLCELGVDIWITPDNVLHCAERRGSDEPTFAVTYGNNVTGYDTDETFTGASVAYTRTRTGWFTLNNDTSELILGGKREAGISLANTDSEDQSIGLSHRAIGAVVMANMVATAQAIVPIEGSIPYVDANISDIIYVLSPSGQQRMGRLLSISVTENDAGTTTWVPEIEIWQSPFGDGVDPTRPRDPVDPNNPYDSSVWVPAAEDWTRFIPDGAGTDYPRAVTMPGTEITGATDIHSGVPSPSPNGRTAPPRNSQQAQRPVANAANNATPPNAERVAIQTTPPLTTAGYHLWVDTTGVT